MPIYMVFQETSGAVTYVASYPSYAEADAAVSTIKLSKPANTSYIIMNGTRYE